MLDLELIGLDEEICDVGFFLLVIAIAISAAANL
jgi:hypothetical protein